MGRSFKEGPFRIGSNSREERRELPRPGGAPDALRASWRRVRCPAVREGPAVSAAFPTLVIPRYDSPGLVLSGALLAASAR
jgi:hypothetical protein